MGTVKKYVTPGGKQGYLARFSFVDGTGKRQHRKRRFRVKKEAEAWVAQQEADQSRGIRFEPSRETFGEALDRWAAGLRVGGRRSASTVAEWRMVARLRFARIRPIRLGELTTGHLNALMTAWESDDALSVSSIRQGCVVLRGVLDAAVADRHISNSPFTRMKRETKAPARSALVIWTPEQAAAFVSTRADDPYRAAWELMLACLLRIGEVAALRWEDIDPDAGVLRVRRTWTRGLDRRLIVGEATKTAESARVVPVPAHLLALLDQERHARTFDDAGWVCASADLAPLTPARLRDAWNAAVKASGLPRITPHGARHSGASTLIASGVPVPVVQRILGHTDPGFTLRVYVHPHEDELDAAIATLSALYRGEVSLTSAQSAPKVVPLTKNARNDAETGS